MERQNGSDPEAPPLANLPTATPELETEVERLLGETEALLDREQGPRSKLRSLPSGSRSIVAAAGAVLAVICVYAFARRSDFSEIPAWQLALVTASYAAPLAGLVWCLLSPLYRVEVRPERARRLILGSFALPFVWAVLPPLAFGHTGSGTTRHGCVFLGLTLGGLFIGLLRALDRAADGDPRSVAMGAAAGGLVANLGVALYCPETRLLHLALVHAPLGLLLLFVYRRVARRLA